MSEQGITVLSLFDGMSCGQLALERSGIPVEKYYASEIKLNGIKVTQDNYPNTIQLGDVTRWREWGIDFSKIDLLIGGSPCQDFSQANRMRKGHKGTKSGLLHTYVDILGHIKHLNPEVKFLLENVRMKQDHQEAVNKLMNCCPVNINSSAVSAQLRNRFYWTNIEIGYVEDRKLLLSNLITSGYTDRKKSRCLTENYSRPNTDPVGMFHRYASTGLFNVVFKNKQHFMDCRDHYSSNFKGLKADEIPRGNTLYEGIRVFNQTEMERLQTVPHGYTKCLSRDEAASVLGDGWTVDVITHIFKQLPFYKQTEIKMRKKNRQIKMTVDIPEEYADDETFMSDLMDVMDDAEWKMKAGDNSVPISSMVLGDVEIGPEE